MIKQYNVKISYWNILYFWYKTVIFNVLNLHFLTKAPTILVLWKIDLIKYLFVNYVEAKSLFQHIQKQVVGKFLNDLITFTQNLTESIFILINTRSSNDVFV